MHSSAMMAVRAAILLICLAVAPLFAIFGKGAPDVIRSLVQKFAGDVAKTNSTTVEQSEPPIFRPGLLAANATHDPSTGSSAVESSLARPVTDPAAGSQRLPTSISTESRATSGALAQPATRLASSGPPAVRMAGVSDEPFAALSRVSHEVSDSPRNSTDAIGAPSTDASQQSGFPADYFHVAERRLRQMGATYYLLETIGQEAPQYRFFCKVAVGNRPDQTRAFVAADRDALAAMNEVVRQVENWRIHAQ